ncbi:fimbria/pilus outer membrane usher protein [Moellerella wisconsensis]|uniref:fimbria/pilus outer membrane usher protein n=2 Tax=Moellerella wisconsensis TaxID=158849 RepID=UPI00307601C6
MPPFLFLAYSEIMKKIKNYLLFFPSLFISINSYSLEFNIEHLNLKEKNNIDLSLFSNKEYNQPGDYYLTVKINGDIINKKEFIKYKEKSNGNTYPCITEELINKLRLKDDIITSLLKMKIKHCYDLSMHHEIKINFDKLLHQLDITVPQAWLINQEKNWINYHQWDNGIPGIMIDYDWHFNYLDTKSANEQYKLSNFGTLGANFSAWRLRGDYQFYYSRQYSKQGESDRHNLQLTQVYAYRAIPEISAKLILGESHLSSELLDSFRFTGMSISSDERMLPPSGRGYAPKIEGIASTNSIITIEKNNIIIQRIQVPAGPFSLDSLPANINGNIKVIIEAENGSKDVRDIYISGVTTMLRPGQWRYSLSSGKTNLFNKTSERNIYFLNGEIFFGLNNRTTLYSGILSSISIQKYEHLTLGINQSLDRLGGLSFDVTNLQHQLNDEKKYSGNRYRVGYLNHLDVTKTDIIFNAQIFSDQDYINMHQYLQERTKNGDKEKRVYSASVRQYLEFLSLSMALTASRTQYWQKDEQQRYSLSLNKSFILGKIKNISTTLNFNHTEGTKNNQQQLFLSLSLPLRQQERVSYNQYYDLTKNTHTNSINYSKNINNHSNFGLSINNTKITKRTLEPSVSGYINYNSAYGDIYTSLSEKPEQYRSFTASLKGGLTITGHGLALHRYSAGHYPRLMIDANGIQGISVNNNQTVTNKKGFGVITSANNFMPSQFKVDINKLPKNTNVNESIFSKTLTEGAIGYYKLDSVSGENIFSMIKFISNKSPPLGSLVLDAITGREVGMIGDEGMVYLTGINKNKRYIINSNNKSCQLKFTEDNSSIVYCQ